MSNNPLVSTDVLATLTEMAPELARAATLVLVEEIPAYGPEVRSAEDLEAVEEANRLALLGFLALASRAGDDLTIAPGRGTIDAAYAFGLYEAQNERDMNALLAAYRIGTRVAWRHMSDELVRQGLPATTIARFAELMFAYMDHLSAASIAGHTEELAARSRADEQHRARLAMALLDTDDVERLEELALLAKWSPPETVAAAVVAADQLRPTLQRLDHRTLIVPGDLAPGLTDDHAVLLIPDAHRDRSAVTAALSGREATLGPTRPWTETRTSFTRAQRATTLIPSRAGGFVDTDEHLVELVVVADADALADLQARVLAPFVGLRPAAAERLGETLRAWLLHQGRREGIAAELDVHPQTVRYRMGQLRELFGDQLTEPRGILELTVALAEPHRTSR